MDAKRRKDELARKALLEAEEGVVVVNEERAPAEVMVKVFAPIGRGRDEHSLLFLPFSLLSSSFLFNKWAPEPTRRSNGSTRHA